MNVSLLSILRARFMHDCVSMPLSMAINAVLGKNQYLPHLIVVLLAQANT